MQLESHEDRDLKHVGGYLNFQSSEVDVRRIFEGVSMISGITVLEFYTIKEKKK